MLRRFFRGALLLLAALPAVFALTLILRFGVDFHQGDEWDPDIAGVYIKAYQHQLTFADLASLHNEHRLLIPRLLYIGLNYFTHWNNIADLVGGWILVLATSLLILWLIHRTNSEDNGDRWPSPSSAGRWFICNLFLFAPAQFENWFSAWGLANALPGLLTVGAIAIAAGNLRHWTKVSLCIVLAAAASFSNGCGFLAWFLAGGVLIFSGSSPGWRMRIQAGVALAISLGLCAGLYAYHYQSPPHRNVYEPDAYKTLFYILTFCGNAFMYGGYSWDTICPLIGTVFLVVLIACAVYAIYKRDPRMVVWLAVAGFGVGTGVLGGLTRGGYGLGQAIISRYVSFSIMLPIALANLIPLVCEELGARFCRASARLMHQIPAFCAAAMAVALVFGIPSALADMRYMQSNRLTGKAALLLMKVLPNNPLIRPTIFVVETTDELLGEAKQMDDIGYVNPPMITSNDAEQILQTDPLESSAATGKLEGVGHDSSNQAMATGYAIFTRQDRGADAVILTYQDLSNHAIIFSMGRVGLARNDVAQSLNNPDIRDCGWTAPIWRDQFPSYFKSAVIRAWALDTATGKAFPLEGTTQISLQ